MSLYNELKGWELDFKGHSKDVEKDYEEFHMFVNDPMFNDFTDYQKEMLKENLLYFVKQLVN